MRKRKSTLMLALVVTLLTNFVSTAQAFHEGGAGFCKGCHMLHPAGEPIGALLIGEDAGSTCLRCHAERGEPHNILSDDGSSFTAGGDFYWLKRSYSWFEGGRTFTSPGESHGHNVVASKFGMYEDAKLRVAPGGDYPASSLSCISCHDPHARWSKEDDEAIPISISGSSWETSAYVDLPANYRLLGGRGFRSSGTVFANDAPVAVAPVDWNETDTNHVDYGSGMSEWCANCHEDMLGDYAGKHPAGASAVFSHRTASAYGRYIRSGDFSGIAQASYLPLVPFERGLSESSGLDPTSTSGPGVGASNVMCLTCHRAHASAFGAAGRWDFSTTFLADSHPGPNDGGSDGANSYYGRNIVSEFGPNQRSLCNKCHVKD